MRIRYFKKTISLLIVLLIFFAVFSANTFAATVAPLFKVEVSPYNAGLPAQYRIYGSYSDYNNISMLKIYFRDDTRVIGQGTYPSNVLVNGVPVRSASFVSLPVEKAFQDYSVQATLLLSNYLNKGDPVEIVLKKEAGIINPLAPATCYKVMIVFVDSRGVEVGQNMSESYTISVSAVSNIKVLLNKPVRGMISEYSITFLTGIKGGLKAYSEEIRIKFPFGTGIPYYLSKSQVLVNGNVSAAVYRDQDNPYILRVFSSENINASSIVSVVFKEGFGLMNTGNVGSNILEISTYREPDWVQSESFEIYEPQIQGLNIVVKPDSIALEPEITLTFTTSPIGYLSPGDNIYIEFPVGFDATAGNLTGNVSVNGTSADGRIDGNILQLKIAESISSNKFVEVKILSGSHIKNPKKSGDYLFNVWTDSDEHKSQFTINIKESFVSELKFETLYSGLSIINEFKISFVTGPVYSLSKHIDSLVIRFDEGFLLPLNAPQNLIRVNNAISTVVSINNNILYVILPVDILPLSAVQIIIPESFGIKNPETLGEYGIKVSTSKEPTEVESNKIKITPLPVVEFTVNPSAPDGINGFYKTNPEIMLSTSNGIKVFYKIDEGEFKEFAQPFKVSEGLHTVYAYAVDAGGNKGDVLKREFNIDTTPPDVKFDNLNSNPVFKGSPGRMTGTVSEPCTLKINEVILELSKENLNFNIELNVYEGMPIAIYVRDLAGNAKTMLLSAHIDSTPPAITYLNMPANLQSAGGSTSTIETTESSYTIQLKLSEKGKVYINNSEVSANGEIFTYYASLSDGENVFAVKAVDLAGNETSQTLVIKKVNEKKIVLQIGATTAILGGNTLELEAAPFIEKNYTLVPLRFISEAFGATVQWNEALKVITLVYNGKSIILQVGSTIAIVEGSTAKLDVAPKIVNGRTFVPIRFISETFGAEVLWDSASKTITITYNP